MKNGLDKLWRSWQALGRDIGDFQARWLLTVFYFTIMIPFALVARLGGDPLHLRSSREETAWLARTTQDEGLSTARRQF